MPTSSRPRRRATRTNAVDPGKRGRPCPSSRPALTTPLPAGQASRFRAGTEVRRKRHSGSSPIPRSGIVPAPLPRPSDGGGCATRKARATRRRSSAPTPTWRRPRSSPPSCGAGRARSPSRNCAPISGAKHNARGHTRRSHDPPPVLCGLYSLVCLWATDLLSTNPLSYAAAWYQQTRVTFSEAIAAIRCQLWLGNNLSRSPPHREPNIIPPDKIRRMQYALCFAA